VNIIDLLSTYDRSNAKTYVDELENHYRKFIDELYTDELFRAKAHKALDEHFEFFNIIFKISFSEALSKDILAQGELMSSKLFSIYLEEQGVKHSLIFALDFMQIDRFGEPLLDPIREKINAQLGKLQGESIIVTQGYICRNARGEVDNLQRGGSDYSASLIAAAVNADVCEIWTDIDGMHNNDPRVVQPTMPIEQLSFDEAAELAYFGAKILHPSSIWPAKENGIPVKLLNTLKPEAKGTLITKNAGGVGVKAVAAKDNITAIRIKSSHMLLAYGFLRKVFEVFEKYNTSIDMITTSEVAVSVTIDNTEFLDEIVGELQPFGTIKIDTDQVIVALVGNEIAQTTDIIKRLFASVSSIPLRMVSYGGSLHNISMLIAKEHKNNMLEQLNRGMFKLK